MIHKNVYRPQLPKIASPIVLAALGTLNSSAEAIELSGDVLQFALPAVAMGATLGHRNEEDGRLWDRTGSLQFVESAALTLGVTYALKYGLDTTRPNGSPHSMPSGHTSISFSSAEFLRKRYGWEWGVPAYAAASWVAYSRVESNPAPPARCRGGSRYRYPQQLRLHPPLPRLECQRHG